MATAPVIKYARATCFIVRFPAPDELQLIETAGRTCHGSGGSTSPKSAERFAQLMVKLGHESVLEHASATVEVHCPISVARQWMRHRLFAYTERSLRSVKLVADCVISDPELPAGPVYAPTYLEDHYVSSVINEQHRVFKSACESAHKAYCSLLELGCTLEDARSVLPVATETKFFATANLREWRHFFDMRCSAGAQHNIRSLALSLLRDFDSRAPGVFTDLVEKYLSSS
jgi:thymidylate synthase (FAD)